MRPSEQPALADEIFQQQQNMLTSCLVKQELGVVNGGLEHTTDMPLVCFQSMKESGFEWPVISEDEQERQLNRMMATMQLSKNLAKPGLPDSKGATRRTESTGFRRVTADVAAGR